MFDSLVYIDRIFSPKDRAWAADLQPILTGNVMEIMFPVAYVSLIHALQTVSDTLK